MTPAQYEKARDAAPSRSEGDELAAVDLGSNSFHLVVAQEQEGGVRLIDRLRDRVGLAEGLRADGSLDAKVAERALACLDRFGQRLRSLRSTRVRAVGTATFRHLRAGRFRERAQEALGFPIEIIPGGEEARLIYLGVAHSLGDDRGRRLVVDIGGGSTECVLGERFESVQERSLSMGCVRWTLEFFADGKITRRRMHRARLAARLQLEPIVEEYKRHGWQSCIGSSGTIRAISRIACREGWTEEELLTPALLERLEEALLKAGRAEKAHLSGLEDDRAPVLAGGLAVLRAVVEGLGIEAMRVSRGALREGVLYDLIGRIHHEDVRDSSVIAFARRFGVDEEQVTRVEETAMRFFGQVKDEWGLGEGERALLRWAVWLHEIGLSVAWSSYHKHGEYLVANGDLRGFSQQERDTLALLVRAHRRRPPAGRLAHLPAPWDERVPLLVVLLRLAVRLHRGRETSSAPRPDLAAEGHSLELLFPGEWLDDHPMTRADAEDESELLGQIGFELTVFG